MGETENTGAASAAEPAPAQAEATQTPPQPTGDAAPAQPKPLTAYQKKKQREADAKRLADERRAKREAAKAAKAAKAQPAGEAAAEETTEEWDEKQRARETGGAWRLALRIVSLVLWPFGYRLDPLTDKECADDVALLAPLASRHRWLEVTIRYAALPYLLVERVATKVRKRDDKKTAGAQTA